MKRIILLTILLGCLVSVGKAGDPVGFGLAGGLLIPVGQDDQESGSLFALKVRARLSSLFTIEPNIHIGKYGEVDITGVGARDGSSLKHYGVDILLGGAVAKTGLKPYAFIGGGIFNTKRDGDETTNKSGWSFGAGFSLGVRDDLDIDLRGRFNIASYEESSSKKSVGVTVGLIYYLGGK
jgi:hypothetical protein